MKSKKRYVIAAASLFGAVVMTSHAFAAGDPWFQHEAVQLRNHSGTAAAPISGGNLPYSPKQTCGLAGCHDAPSFFLWGIDNFYESHWTKASKVQWNRVGSTGNRDGVAISYDVPYPLHGVSAGYHFQQGRNVPWGANQQDFYHVPEFTSSPGMYGKY